MCATTDLSFGRKTLQHFIVDRHLGIVLADTLVHEGADLAPPLVLHQQCLLALVNSHKRGSSQTPTKNGCLLVLRNVLKEHPIKIQAPNIE